MSLALTLLQTPERPARPDIPASNHPDADSSDGEHAAGPRSASVNSTDLLQGQKAVEIKHNGSTYRLQATRLGKLILTK